jgi:hypothetical protein
MATCRASGTRGTRARRGAVRRAFAPADRALPPRAAPRAAVGLLVLLLAGGADPAGGLTVNYESRAPRTRSTPSAPRRRPRCGATCCGDAVAAVADVDRPSRTWRDRAGELMRAPPRAAARRTARRRRLRRQWRRRHGAARAAVRADVARDLSVDTEAACRAARRQAARCSRAATSCRWRRPGPGGDGPVRPGADAGRDDGFLVGTFGLPPCSTVC